LKNLFYFTVFGLFSFIVYSQEKEAFGIPANGVVPILRNKIELFGSSNSNSDGANRKSFQSETTLSSQPTGTSQVVGVTAGELSVSLSGGAKYDVPILVPKGLNGIEPKISISYNSQAGNDILGYGWRINGVSSITRIASTIYHDGVNREVKYDTQDRFALDGQRLMLKNPSDVYGGDGVEYQTENFTNLKITSHGILSTGPVYFLVEFPDGSKAYYGNSQNSHSKLGWNITSLVNSLDIRIDYEYIFSNNISLISRIKYGSQGTSSQINIIDFIYKSRNRVEQAYVNGHLLNVSNILSEIKIKSSNVGFKNYFFEHNLNSLGYERLIKVIEKSGDNSESLNPTVFEYQDSPENISVNPNGTSISMTGVNYLTSSTISGDFNGDGNQDIILYPTTGINSRKKYWYFDDINSNSLNIGYEHNVGAFQEMLPINWISHNGKLMPDQGWVIVKKENPLTTSFNCYSSGIANPIYFQYRIDFDFPRIEFGYFKHPCVSSRLSQSRVSIEPIDPVDSEPTWIVIEKEIPKIYLTGDFNGDGLSDMVAIEKSVTFQYSDYCSNYNYNYSAGKAFFINLDRRLVVDQISHSGNIDYTNDCQVHVADFNGDKKTDLYIFKNGNVKIYTLNSNNVLTLIRSFSHTNISLSRPILLGDYNGDGKTDFIVPNNYGNNYTKYLSDGVTFKNSSEIYPFTYYESAVLGSEIDLSHLIPYDFNADGKTDIVRVHNASAGSLANITVEYYKNLGPSFVSQMAAYTGVSSNIGAYAIPVVLNHDKANPNSELSFVSKGSIFNFRCNKDNYEDTLLRSITLGNGVKEKIYYSTLNSICDNLNCDSSYGVNGYVENYPNFDIINAPQLRLVSKIEKQNFNSSKFKQYSYFGGVTNYLGKGFLGFRAIANTDWYEDGQTKITNVTKFDLDKNGVIKESYSVSGEFFGNIDFNNYSPTNYIQKVLYDNNYELANNLVYKIKNNSTIKYNGLNNTSQETFYTYDIYYNPLTVETRYKNGSVLEKTELSIIDYMPIQSTPSYFLGKIYKKNISVTTYNAGVISDFTTAEEKYTYNSNNFISKIEKKGHLTDYLKEEFEYDGFGNLIEKSITAGTLTPRTQLFGYDTSGRFMTSSTDVEGLTTNYVYNSSTGLLLSEQLPSNSGYPLLTSYLYDKWGKIVRVTDYLGNKLNYYYDWLSVSNSGNYAVGAVSDDGSYNVVWYDDYDRKMAEGYRTINDSNSSESNMLWKSYAYDIHDRIIKESEPIMSFFPNTSIVSKEVNYDLFGRPIKIVESGGKITDISYNGLTVNSSDGVSTSVITKNSYGKIVSKSDNGGLINYTYYANGNLKQSTLGNVSLNLEQDGWGRKTKLIDPSAGEYIYEYNELGETTKTKSPKGETIYTLDNFGKITEKTIIGINGDPTNLKTTYTYDTTTKLLTNTRFDDFLSGFYTLYSFGYDNYKRLNFSDESGFNAYYQRATTFDSYGRPDKEFYRAVNTFDNKSSEKWIKNTYKNGFHWQILDNTTNQLLWQTSKVNSRGSLIKGLYGNGLELNVTYDQFGFPSKIKNDKNNGNGVINLFTLNTEFDSERGNLTNRYNSLFDSQEEFTYDDLDRLLTWSSVNFLSEYKFETGTDGFLATNSGVNISHEVTTFFKRLKVETTTNFEGTKKKILDNANIGDKIKVSGKIYFRNLQAGNYIKFSVMERDPLTGQTIQVDYGTVTGISNFTFDHTVSQYSEIYLKVVAGNDLLPQPSIIFTLDDIKVELIKLYSQTYDNFGRIDENEIGKYNYTNNSKPYQNTSVNVNSESLDYYLTRNNLNVTYNVFKSPIDIIEEGKDKLSFTYNMNNNRSTMYYGSNDNDKMLRPYRKHYSIDGSMEIKQNIQNGTVEFITYIGGSAYSAPVVLKSDGSSQEYLYLHRDYLSSVVAITNQSGDIVEKRKFDPWGNVVKVEDGVGNILSKLTILDRGYTGHEHLQGVNLIHMNGRLYDPIIHRFLQPDNFIQDPYNTQNYNRYGYVLNNPLKYVDFNGENYSGTEGGGEGMSDYQQSGLGSIISTIAQNWDELGIKDFFNDNVSNGFKSAGNWFSNNLKSANGWVDRNLRSIGRWLFGSSPEPQTISVPQFNQVQSVNGWQNGGFQNSGKLNFDPNLVSYVIKNSDGVTLEEYNKMPIWQQMLTERPGVTTGMVEFGPAKGAKYLMKMLARERTTLVEVKKIGEFWKYTTKTMSRNGNESYTLVTKYINSNGRTIKWFHDTFDKTGRFIHRGWTEGSTKVHLWWNGIKQYGNEFFEIFR
jgi:RHS repeat-associated protein